MRNLLLASSAIVAAVALAGTASAQSQSNGTPVVATINIDGIDVNGVAVINSQGVGNSVGANGAINVNLFGQSQAGQLNNGAITSSLYVIDSEFDEAELGSVAVGNTVAVDVGGTVLINRPGLIGPGGAPSAIQQNNGVIVARTDIETSEFGDLTATSTALGNNLSATGAFVTIGSLANDFTQDNAGAISSELEISGTGFFDAVTFDSIVGGATSVGNNLNLGSANLGSGIEQTNNAPINAMVDLSWTGGFGAEADLTSLAVGNSFSIDNLTGRVDQGNMSAVRADMDLNWVGFGGDSSFAAQAIGNLATATGGMTAQGTSFPHTSATVVADLDVSFSAFGNASLSSLAVGNMANLTNATGYTYQTNQADALASTNLNNVFGFGDLTVNATAAANVLNVMGSTNNIYQMAYPHGPVNATVTINNSTFGGALNVGSVGIGNSISFSAP